MIANAYDTWLVGSPSEAKQDDVMAISDGMSHDRAIIIQVSLPCITEEYRSSFFSRTIRSTASMKWCSPSPINVKVICTITVSLRKSSASFSTNRTAKLIAHSAVTNWKKTMLTKKEFDGAVLILLFSKSNISIDPLITIDIVSAEQKSSI